MLPIDAVAQMIRGLRQRRDRDIEELTELGGLVATKAFGDIPRARGRGVAKLIAEI
jgi:hypothetical protein